VCAVIAAVILVYTIFILFEANPANGLVSFTRGVYQDFGGFTQFRAQLTNAAMTIMGSGWAALSWEPVAKRLVTTQIYDHQSNITQGGVPILVLDAWEHAFYLQYGPDKKSFFEAVWNIWNWTDVAQRFEKVRTLDLSVRGATDR